MMAGIVHLSVGPTSFLVGFAVTEVIAWLSKFSKKEVLLMTKKVVDEVTAFANEQKERAIAFREAHLSFGDTPLTSL
jgi:hypothetical protein